MSIYDFSTLMSETRRLASEYRNQTGHSLPVTVELARFDGITLLGLSESDDSGNQESESAIGDSVGFRKEDDEWKTIQIKGRVLFPGGKSRQRIGQLNLQENWDYTVLVIYNPDYQPHQIYQASRKVIEENLATVKENKRGAMTVVKFKAIGECIWDAESQALSTDTVHSETKSV